jgi:hypothetical protein
MNAPPFSVINRPNFPVMVWCKTWDSQRDACEENHLLLLHFPRFVFNPDDGGSSFLRNIDELLRGSPGHITDDNIPRFTVCFLGGKNRNLIFLSWTSSLVSNKWMDLSSFHCIYGCNMYLKPRTRVTHVGALRDISRENIVCWISRNIHGALF